MCIAILTLFEYKLVLKQRNMFVEKKMSESETKRLKQTRENVIESLRGQQRALEEEKALLEREEALLASRKNSLEDRERRLQAYQAKIAAYREKLKNNMNPGIIPMVIAMLKANNELTVKTLGRISTLTHHAYDDLLLPLWEEVYLNFFDEDDHEDHLIKLWEDKKTGKIYTSDQLDFDDSDDEELMFDEHYVTGTKIKVIFVGKALSKSFKATLDELSTPDKRYNESTYWKRAVEYTTRMNKTNDKKQDIVPWTPFTIPWISSRLDKEGTILFEWIECLEKDGTARHYLSDKESTRCWSMAGFFKNNPVYFATLGVFFDQQKIPRVTGNDHFKSCFVYRKDGTWSSYLVYEKSMSSFSYFKNTETVDTFYPLTHGQYGFSVHPSNKYMCYVTDRYTLRFYNLETMQEMKEVSTAPIPRSEMVGKLYWSPDGQRLYMSYKSGIAVYSFPDVTKPPVYRDVPDLIDFELSKDGSTLFLVSKAKYHFLDTSFSVEMQSQYRDTKDGTLEYVTSCFAVNRPIVYIVERRKEDNFHRVVSVHAFAALVSTPYHQKE